MSTTSGSNEGGDSTFFATCSEEGVGIWNLNMSAATPPALRAPFANHHGKGGVRCVDWNHNNQVYATCGYDGCIKLTYMSNGKVIATLPSSPSPAEEDAPISSLSFSIGSRFLCSGGVNGKVKLWDLKKQKLVRKMGLPENEHTSVTCVQFNSKDTHIASGHAGGGLHVISVLRSSTVDTLRPAGNVGPVRSIQHSPMVKSLLASVYEDGSLFVWDTNRGRAVVSEYGAHAGKAATGVRFSRASRTLLCTSGLDGLLLFHDLNNDGSVVRSLGRAEDPLTSVCFLDDGVTVLGGTARGEILGFDLRKESGGGVVWSVRAHGSTSGGGRDSAVRWIAGCRSAVRARGGRGRGARVVEKHRNRNSQESKHRVNAAATTQVSVGLSKESRSSARATEDHVEAIAKTNSNANKTSKTDVDRVTHLPPPPAPMPAVVPAITGSRSTETKIKDMIEERKVKDGERSSVTAVTSFASKPDTAAVVESKSEDDREAKLAFSLEYLKDILDDRMELMEERHHDDVRDLHLELVRQLHIQEQRVATLLENQREWMKAALDENRALREEVESLRDLH